MAQIKPFKAVRPRKDVADRVAALPYDVYDRKEARSAALIEPLSFLNIDRPETQFEENYDMYAPEVYKKASDMLKNEIEEGVYTTDDNKYYYIYELTMNERTQTGICAVASIDDYDNGIIKKHENTREEKEIDRIKHVDACSAQTGPIFLTYRSNDIINQAVKRVKDHAPENDFVSEDGIRHRVWIVREETEAEAILKAFEGIDRIYIADGHHRAASAVKVGKMRRENAERTYGKYNPDDEYNYFLSVLFPETDLMIMPYNRVVKDLNGLTESEFIDKLSEIFTVEERKKAVLPSDKGEISMLLGLKWYKLTARIDYSKEKNPVKRLDVSMLQEKVLSPLLGINDPKTSERIDFVGGIRGLSELEKRCGTDCAVAFAMYPTSINELFEVADMDMLMPPKSTWFEPKLRSGLFIHRF